MTKHAIRTLVVLVIFFIGCSKNDQKVQTENTMANYPEPNADVNIAFSKGKIFNFSYSDKRFGLNVQNGMMEGLYDPADMDRVNKAFVTSVGLAPRQSGAYRLVFYTGATSQQLSRVIITERERWLENLPTDQKIINIIEMASLPKSDRALNNQELRNTSKGV